MRPMNEREIFTSDATVVQVDEQDPQQMQVSPTAHCAADRLGHDSWQPFQQWWQRQRTCTSTANTFHEKHDAHGPQKYSDKLLNA